jgi:hypothetical protein
MNLSILPMNIFFRMEFINILKKSYRALYLNGVRSNERIKHIHHWIKEKFQQKLGNSYKYYSYDPNDSSKKEFKIKGAFYDKCCDITICNSDNKPLATVSVKLITSNFKQNANNYFESMLGESYNIKKEGILYAHVLICPNPLPYYFKGGEFKCEEKLKDRDFLKYIKLSQSNDVFSPDYISINIIDLKTKDYINPSIFKNLDIDNQMKYLETITSGLNISDNNSFGANTQKYLNNSNIEILIENLSKDIKLIN